jgi:hypothetical protein
MLQFLRHSKTITILEDAAAFWKYCNARQSMQDTPDGPLAEAEERLDLRAGQAIKALLELEVGPEEGSNRVQCQNWDWNDDRTRGVYMLRSAFRPELLPKLQSLLVGEFADFQVVILLYETWQSDEWGHLHLERSRLAIQRNVVQAYAIVA